MFKLNKLMTILSSLIMFVLGVLTIIGMITGHITWNIMYVFFGAMWILLGALSFKGSLKMTEKDYRRQRVNRNPYAARRILLFLGLVMLFMAVAIYVNIRASEAGRDMHRILIAEGAAAAAVVIAYVLEIRNIFKSRKDNKIQDPGFAEFPIYINDRYFSMVIDELENRENISYLKGYLHGTANAGDKVFFYFSDGSVFKGQIRGITAEDTACEEIHDSPCVLEIDTGGKMEFHPFSLCTSLLPYGSNDPSQVVSSPRISGLLNGYTEQKDKDGYISYLAGLIAHSSFLVRLSKADVKRPWYAKISDYFFGYQGPVRVPVVTAEDSDQPDSLPIYTDWMAVTRADKLSPKEDMITLLSFEELSRYMQRPIGGIVINPFGPVDFFMSEDFVHSLQKHLTQEKKTS